MKDLEQYYTNLKTQTNNQLGLYLFCCSISVVWAIYVLFFNSRIVGTIATFCLNLYLKQYSKNVYIQIRALSISFLSGKIMFRGVHYATVDYMMYIQDGWISFAYWKPQFTKEIDKNTNNKYNNDFVNEGKFSKNDSRKATTDKQTNCIYKKTARLNIFLCNFQLHYYNSWKVGHENASAANPKKSQSNTNEVDSSSVGEPNTNRSLLMFFRNSLNSLFNNISSNANDLVNDPNNLKNSKKKLVINDINNIEHFVENNNKNQEKNLTEDLMQLFSVVNIRIQKGRICAGNLTLPSLVSFRISNAKMELVTEKSQSKLDEYCFILRGELNKLEVSLIPNKKHPLCETNKINSEKKSDNRVLFLKSVSSDFEYIQDVPSILTFDRRFLQKNETGELIQNENEPQWSLVLNCNKQTIINYGPWYDRQREYLWGFFFPQTYETLEPQPEPTLNERRQTSKFDFTLNLKDTNTEINIIFSNLFNPINIPNSTKHNSSAVAEDLSRFCIPNERKLCLRCKSQSLLKCSFPWLTKQYGYKTTILGTFNSVHSFTNLSFKQLFSAETLKLDVEINYPLRWNDMQTWNINVELTKATIFFVFYHKFFFQDLINDWSSKSMADLRRFVPYIYNILVKINDCELVLPCNQHNWIDTNVLKNNCFFEILASLAVIKMSFPFEEFLPETTMIPLDIKITDAAARFYVPTINPNLLLLKILKKKLKYVSLDNGIQTTFDAKKWSRFNKENQQDQQQNTSNQNLNSDLDKTETQVVNTAAYLDNKEKPVIQSFKSFSDQINLKSSKSNQKQQQPQSQSQQQPQQQPQQANNKQSSKTAKTSKKTSFRKTNDSINNFTTKINSSGKHSKNSPQFNLNDTSPDLLENWFECWQTNYASVVLNYDYNPSPILDWSNKRLPTVNALSGLKSPKFDCEILKPDLICLDIEIGPSIVMLYGTFLRRLWFIKESYFGWDQYYTEMPYDLSDVKPADLDLSGKQKKVSKPFYDVPIQLMSCDHTDPRNFRTLSVRLSLAIHNLNGHLVMDIEDNDEKLPFPIGFTDRIALELDKNYIETKLQLFINPVNIFIVDNVDRGFDRNVCQGRLSLSAVQVRGHAMFSDEGRVKTDTLEYAWLLEILLGDISGSIAPVQTQHLIYAVETILTLILENEFDLEPVYLDRLDPGLPYKYEVTRFSIDSINLFLVEPGTALNLELYPIRVSMCNSHTQEYAKGLSASIKTFQVKLFLNEASRTDDKSFKSRMSSNVSGANQFGKFDSSKTSSRNHSNSILTDRNSSVSSIVLSSLDSSSLASIDSNLSMNNNNNKSATLVNKKSIDSNDDDLFKLDTNNREIGSNGLRFRSKNQQPKQLDSNDFNYWFECFCLSTGVINFDLALDRGEPIKQIEFLRVHDKKTKRLYFLWNSVELDSIYKPSSSSIPSPSMTTGSGSGINMKSSNQNEYVNQFAYKTFQLATNSQKRICGCIGGCCFYSVFNDMYNLPKENHQSNDGGGVNDDFIFNLNKSITRSNQNFSQSLFFSDKKILNSQPIMMNKYKRRPYTSYRINSWDSMSTSSKDLNQRDTFVATTPSQRDPIDTKQVNNELNKNGSFILSSSSSRSSSKSPPSPSSPSSSSSSSSSESVIINEDTQNINVLTKEKLFPKRSDLNLNKLRKSSKNSSVSTSQLSTIINPIESINKIVTNRKSISSTSSSSTFSSNRTINLNDDDYYTADEEDINADDDAQSSSNNRISKNSRSSNNSNKQRLVKHISSSTRINSMSNNGDEPITKHKSTRFSLKSVQSSKSKSSFVSTKDFIQKLKRENSIGNQTNNQNEKGLTNGGNTTSKLYKERSNTKVNFQNEWPQVANPNERQTLENQRPIKLDLKNNSNNQHQQNDDYLNKRPTAAAAASAFQSCHSFTTHSQIEPEMTLKFDIQRPILDSVLPKYCYLKYLSRTNVTNWNKTFSYPFYDDLKNESIHFDYIQKGFDCSYVKRCLPRISHSNTKNQNDYSTKSGNYMKKKQSAAAAAAGVAGRGEEVEGEEETDLSSSVKCRINLKFTNSIEFYVTPLTLTGVERLIKGLKTYKISPNYLITKMQNKSQDYFTSNSLIGVISKTQVSMNIPQILFCSLQCGLAEGDKIANAFSNTLAHPDEFITLTLFTFCIHSIQTQLIDSQNKSAAIFMIDKIESQFCRLYENENLQALNNNSSHTDINNSSSVGGGAAGGGVESNSKNNNSQKSPRRTTIRLSCISDMHSKVSISCFKDNDLYTNKDKFKQIKNSIMYECAFERISIKAVKKLNDKFSDETPNGSGGPGGADGSGSAGIKKPSNEPVGERGGRGVEEVIDKTDKNKQIQDDENNGAVADADSLDWSECSHETNSSTKTVEEIKNESRQKPNPYQQSQQQQKDERDEKKSTSQEKSSSSNNNNNNNNKTNSNSQSQQEAPSNSGSSTGGAAGGSTSSSSSSSHNRLSICEFEIDKIWFSFPEPPISPKGKRKIPYTRYDWNLLSSVSPAVSSWLCAAKHSLNPIKDCVEYYNRQIVRTMASLIAGSLKNKERLEKRIDQFYNRNMLMNDFMENNNNNMPTAVAKQSRSKLGSKSSAHNADINSNGHGLINLLTHKKTIDINFLSNYLTQHSYGLMNDPNFLLVNIIRSYLYFFDDDFQADMTSKQIPDEKYLKRATNELLNTWSSILIKPTEEKLLNPATNLKNEQLIGYLINDSLNDLLIDMSQHNFDQKLANDFKFLNEFQQVDMNNFNSLSSDTSTLSESDNNDNNNANANPNTNTNANTNNNNKKKSTKQDIESLNLQSNSTKVTGINPASTNVNANNDDEENMNTLNNQFDLQQQQQQQQQHRVKSFNQFANKHNLQSQDLLKNKSQLTTNNANANATAKTKQQIKNSSNEIFKPFLNFIGIDTPTGKFIENLFKEFGSFINGSLNINSVDINILGKQVQLLNASKDSLNNGYGNGTNGANGNKFPLANDKSNVKYRSFHYKKTNNQNNNIDFSKMPFGKQDLFENEKVITTILSFDSLLFNLSIRKINSDNMPTPGASVAAVPNNTAFENNRVANSSILKQTTNTTNSKTNTIVDKNNRPMSMVNPVYVAVNNLEQQDNTTAKPKATNKHQIMRYYAKIDTNMQLNNLTQEVNMPLLRLVHQLYSIIADAIDYDKEQNKIISNSVLIKCDEFPGESFFSEYNSPKHKNHVVLTDSWKFMVDILESADSETRCIEKDEVSDFNRLKNQSIKGSNNERPKYFLARDNNNLSLFGWVIIKRINSRATLGTLAFNGEMNNVQLSFTFGQKSIGPSSYSKHLYHGSFSASMGSTFGKLFENDTQQNVVQMRVAKCHLFGSLKKYQLKNNISSFVHIGQIYIDVPLRPMVVHGVVYRESKVIEQKILPEIKNFVIFENDEEMSNSSINETLVEATAAGAAGANNSSNQTSRLNNLRSSDSNYTPKSASLNLNKEMSPTQTTAATTLTNDNPDLNDYVTYQMNNNNNLTEKQKAQLKTPKASIVQSSFLNKKSREKYIILENENIIRKSNHIAFELKLKLDGCEIRAKLLETPNLQAAYLINNVECNSFITNESSKVSCHLKSHCLSFKCDDEILTTPTSQPRYTTTNINTDTHGTRAKSASSSSAKSKMQQQNSMLYTAVHNMMTQQVNFKGVDNDSSTQYLEMMTTMNSLDDSTNFYLPSISLNGSYLSNQIQLEKLFTSKYTDIINSTTTTGNNNNNNATTTTTTTSTTNNNNNNSKKKKSTIIKDNSSSNLKDFKSFNLVDVHFKIAPLYRELNAEVIAKLVFVAKIFIKEMNNILQAVYTSDTESSSHNSAAAAAAAAQFLETKQQNTKNNSNQNTLTGSSGGGGGGGATSGSGNALLYYDLLVQVGKISFTGITPTNTALTLCTGEDNILTLTNKNLNVQLNDNLSQKAFMNNYSLKPSIEAKCNISVELKTALKPKLNKTSQNNGYEPTNDSLFTNSKRRESKVNFSKENGQNNKNDSKLPGGSGSGGGSGSSDKDDKDWFQLAYFNTKFDLRNAVKTSQTGFDRESITITVEKPRFYLQPGAVDNAILFWLNYKSTYEYWLQQRQQFSDLLIDQQLKRSTSPIANIYNIHSNVTNASSSSSAATASSTTTNHQQAEQTNLNINYLALKLRVTGLGLALPLSNKITKDIFKTNIDCLVISLNETSIYACSSGCVVSKGQFNNFCLRFAENFNLNSSEWSPIIAQDNSKMMGNSNVQLSKTLMNAWVVPSGNYEVCSSTIEKQNEKFSISADILESSPIWILSVKWKMEGIEVNLDTSIGKWLSKLADTVTRLAETQNNNESTNNLDQESEIRKLKKDLKYYKETGDSSKINLIQSRLDVLSLASYPEKAKQIFVKTRNNLKGQLGFNTNNQRMYSTQFPKKMTNSELYSKNLLPSLISPTQKKNILQTTDSNSRLHHFRSKSVDNRTQRRHSISNDDLNFAYLDNNNKQPPIESNANNNDKNQLLLKDASKTCFNSQNMKSDKLLMPNEWDSNQQVESEPKTNASFAQQSQLAATAPAIDFKLDVKIEISSGKCILHASKLSGLGKNDFESHLKADHMSGGSAGMYGSHLNDMHNKANAFMGGSGGGGMSSSKKFNLFYEPEMRNTNFIFPAIRVKSFYESSHKRLDNRLSKKANLYAMIKIESFVMPTFSSKILNREILTSRDMCISPALLDFLEQTLEPLNLIKSSFETNSVITTPSNNNYGRMGNNSQSPNRDDYEQFKSNSKHQQQQQQQTEFYVNSPGEVHHQRFNDSDRKESNAKKNISNESKQQSDNNNQSSKDLKVQQKSQEHTYFPVEVVVFVSMLPSCIRFTCLPQSTMECLLKLPTLEMVFSTYKLDNTLQDSLLHKLKDEDEIPNENAKKQFKLSTENGTASPGLKNAQEGGLSVTCSMTDFSLKFYNRLALRNHSDARFFYSDQSSFSDDKDSLSIKVSYIKVNISRSRRISAKELTRWSDMMNQTDNSMRSLDDKITYNDVKLSVLADIGSSSFVYDMRNIKEVFIFPKIWYRRSLARRLFLGEETILPYNPNENKDYMNTQKSEFSNNFQDISRRPKTLALNMDENSFCINTKWQTLVLISINLADLEVKMNVGSVMGNVCLLARNARAKSKVSINNFGKKRVLLNFVLDNARLIAEGGSNGCLLRIQDITSAIEINDKDDETQCPFNRIEFGIFATECRIDSAYNQATPILAFRLSGLSIKLNDSWDPNTTDSNKIPEAILELNVTWDQLHLMITKSTTPDLIIMYYKLIDFFEKQLNEGKDYIKQCELDLFYEFKVKQQFVEKPEKAVKKNFVANGGSIQLKGNNFTLITFHGNNFRAKKWAVFSLNEPSLDFAAQTYQKKGEVNQQNMGFYLGRNQRKRDMASIYMVYNDSTNIFTRFQTINEWFEYAHGNIDAVGLRDFPQFSSDEHISLNQKPKKHKLNEQTKWEEIFHLPSLQILCDSTHENNTVKFEFKTDFHDHLLLTFRTEMFGFLHELITSYIKETDIIRGKEEYIPQSKKDERIYECIKWDLEPTLRLISKFGSSVEPPGVDALLRSLGFHHARTTIPKWSQRGLLDNLNDLIYHLIKVYVKLLSDHDFSNIKKIKS